MALLLVKFDELSGTTERPRSVGVNGVDVCDVINESDGVIFESGSINRKKDKLKNKISREQII